MANPLLFPDRHISQYLRFLPDSKTRLILPAEFILTAHYVDDDIPSAEKDGSNGRARAPCQKKSLRRGIPYGPSREPQANWPFPSPHRRQTTPPTTSFPLPRTRFRISCFHGQPSALSRPSWHIAHAHNPSSRAPRLRCSCRNPRHHSATTSPKPH